MKTICPEDIHVGKDVMGRLLFGEVWQRDIYKIKDFYRKYGDANVKAVVDVGANIGYFSLLATCLFTNAFRLAIEPGDIAYPMLVENMNDLDVRCEKIALGNGKMASWIEDSNWCGSDRIVCGEGNVPTMRLSQILEKFNIPKSGIIFKIDCEGSERWLVDDVELLEWMKGCVYFTAEYHDVIGNPKTLWDEWLAKVFPGSVVEQQILGSYGSMNLHHYCVQHIAI
jgi:FkbM family methyltransferase